MNIDRFQETLAATAAGFGESVGRSMPNSPYRDLHLWALKSQEKEVWWQIFGIPQFAKLTVSLLADLVSKTQWPYLLDYATIMNRYLIYEAISDNFANFLLPRDPNDAAQKLRIQVLHTLNYTTVTRLESAETPTTDLLTSARFAVDKLSCFANSITQDEQTVFARRLLDERPDLSLHDLEYGGWSVLVANVETCVEVGRILKGTLLAPFLRRGLQWRYEAVNKLLYAHDLSPAEMVDVSTYAVLVIPFLTYYISVINEMIRPTERLNAIVEDGLLQKALYKAGLLVRVANDVGTELLTQPEYQQMLLEVLAHNSNAHRTINETLLDLTGALPFLTRFQKDIAFGEFNTCTYNVGHLPCSPESVAHFKRNLTYLSHTYEQNRAELISDLEIITERMEDDATSKLIWRFVEFHEHLYSYPFNSQTGEYATKPSTQTLLDWLNTR